MLGHVQVFGIKLSATESFAERVDFFLPLRVYLLLQKLINILF
jgi:hypothetical protein